MSMTMVSLQDVNDTLEKWSDNLIDEVRKRDDGQVPLELAIDILDMLQNDMNKIKKYNVNSKPS
jgi:hypothetical protein